MNRWTILAVLFSARAVMGFQFQSIASISDFLIPGLGIAYAEIGTLVGLYLLPGVIFAYPGGALGKRFGDRRLVLAGLALMTAGGLIVGLADTYSAAVIGRIVCGTGAVFLNVLLTKMLLDWFAGREVMTAMGILVNSWPFGIAAGLMSQGWIASNWSWPIVQYIGAGLAVGGFLLVAMLYRAPENTAAASSPSMKAPGLSAAEITLTSLAGAIWCLYNVALIVVISFAANVLQAQGALLTEAAWLVSVGTWLGIITLPAGGFVAQRWKSPNAVMVICFMAATLIILWIPMMAWPLVSFILYGIFAWSPAGAIMALPGEVLQAENRGPGMGIFFTWYYVGMGTLPAVAGLSLDMSGNPAAPMYFAAAAMSLCIPLLGAFRFLKGRLGISGRRLRGAGQACAE